MGMLTTFNRCKGSLYMYAIIIAFHFGLHQGRAETYIDIGSFDISHMIIQVADPHSCE